MKHGIQSIIAAAGLAVASFIPVSADAAQNKDEILGRMTPGEITRIMQENGYAAYVDEDGEGDPMIIANADGTKFGLVFFDCEKDGAMPDRYCTDLEFMAIYDVDKKPALVKLNEWNAGQAFGKAYLRDETSVSLEMPINLAKGVSESFIVSSLEWWASIMTSFDKHMWPK